MQAVTFKFIAQLFNQRLNRLGCSEVRDLQSADHEVYLPRDGMIKLHRHRVIARNTAFTGTGRKLLLQLRAQLRYMNHHNSPLGWLAIPSTATVWNWGSMRLFLNLFHRGRGTGQKTPCRTLTD
ncbi:hypothetical protein EMIT0P294_11005 [Pseudomonas sp. IT-P294]